MKEFFPENAVEYFVSYYDYYQPEAYVPSPLIPILQKDSSINDEIDKLRHLCHSRSFRAAGCGDRGLRFLYLWSWKFPSGII